MKTCSSCKIDKTLDSFRLRKDGRNNFVCTDCKNFKCREWRRNNKESNKLSVENWRNNNLDRVKIKRQEYLTNNRELLAEKSRIYRKNNPEKWRETKHQSTLKNKHKYKAKINAASRSYKIKKRQSSKYLTELLKSEITTIYENCANMTKELNIEYQVDHIIPINNELVCGLHVPWNLQILTKDENLFKTNKFDLTYNNDTWRLDYGYSDIN